MKRKVSKLRPSPNEEARIIREELDRRRKLRIQQVREQQRLIALQIRREVERRRQQELQQLEEQLREDWERRQTEKLHTLQSLYLESLQLIGQSHRSAKETEADLAAAAQREEEHHAKAGERYREALKELKVQQTKEQERQKRFINARKKALQTEKERSAKVAKLPPPPPDPIQDIDPRKPHVVQRSDLNAFAATHYHMPASAVEKELEAAQPDARLEADLESRKLQELQREEQRRREEQLEKARVRGRQALRREQLEQDRQRLLVELQHLQQTDLLRRRQQVTQMPPQIFQPLYQRQEAREELQRQLEFAFEDMYTGERRVKGDLVVQLVPEPLPATSSTGQDLDLDPDRDLDVTVDENAEREAENIQNEVEGEKEAADGAAPPPGAAPPRQALRKLLDRIRSQRTDWISGRVPPSVDSEPNPERDTSIETGSLTPEALAVESTEPPTAAEPSLPADFLSRILEAEEERKKREAELEVEKQQQLHLLQELEEQKAKLELMLQEAQRETEQLRAAAQQEAPLLQTQAPVQDQDQDQDRTPTSLTSEEDAAAPAEDDVSTTRLRRYQQRLLQQNRIHQRSVEVARQRLEEYQRALRIRHSLTAAASLRPPVHPALLAPPSDSRPATPSDVLLPAFSSSGAGSSGTSDPSVTNWFGSDAASLADSQSILDRAATRLPDRTGASPVAAHGSAGSSASFDPTTPTDQQEEELQHLRRQKEALQALIDADRRSGSDSSSDSSDPQDAERNRLQLLASLLRAIEESNGGSLSHLEEPEDGDEDLTAAAPLVPAVVPPEPSVLLHPPRTQKPPVTRVKLGFKWMIPQQHELSAIQEVETPDSLSRVADYRPDSAERRLASSGPEDDDASHLQEGSGFFSTSDWVLESGSISSCRPNSAGWRVGFPGPEDEARSHSAGGSEHDSRQSGPVSSCRSDSAGTRFVSSGPEDDVPPRPAELSLQAGSVSLSTSDRTAESPSASSFRPSSPGKRVVSLGPEDDVPPRPADGRVGSETSGRLPWKERLLPGAATTPESSGSAMKATSAPGSGSGRGADWPGPAAPSSRSPSEVLSSTTISSGSYVSTDPEPNGDDPRLCGPTGPGSGAVSSAGFLDSAVPAGPLVDPVFSDSVIQRIIDKYTRELDVSLGAAGTATDGDALEESGSSLSQPSRMEDETSAGRRAARRHPVADQHQNPEQTPPSRPALDQSPSCEAPESLSVLERLVGQPSAQSSMIGTRPGPPGRSGWDSTLSRMIGRLSRQSDAPAVWAGQDSSEPSWSDELPEVRMRVLVGELGERSGEQSSGAESRLPRCLAQSPPDSNPVLQNRAGLEELDPHGADDSFLPLHPEITHNETADPPVTFHLPDLDTSDDSSLEQLRAEEPDGRRDVQESFCRLAVSDCVQQDGVPTSHTSPTSPAPPAPASPPCASGEASALGSSDPGSSRVSVPVGEGQDFSSSEIPPESDGNRGILETSQITLVSLTDTTLQDAVATDDEGPQDGPDGVAMETEPTEGAETTLAHPAPSASLLEFLWSPSRSQQDVFQRRRRVLMQRSERRVQEIKAKRAAARNGATSRVLVEGRDPGGAAVQNVPRKETEDRKRAERKLRPPAPGRRSGPQIGADVRISDPDQRKRNLSEMHQRTQRLYEQLEEVKQQRAARSRQEDWARNRLRAQEFHRKTLQKLRAKQTPTF